MGADPNRPGSKAIVREIRVTRGTGRGDGLRVCDVEIEPATAEAWGREAASIQIPVLGMAPIIGCDGTTYTLSCDAGFAKLSMGWWSDHPREWAELTTWARSMMRRLHALTSPEESPAHLEI
ncbi:MAG: hypothetical protein IPK82_17705 [Polyangiaceae bacterium]|nr:hypothetical protein [Polyangiaceae bacterium]